jgi:hypothetical protein
MLGVWGDLSNLLESFIVDQAANPLIVKLLIAAEAHKVLAALRDIVVRNAESVAR